MKYSLLDLTQSILSNLNSDEVNSISDTTESMQVAEIIKQTYFNLISRSDLPEHYQLIQLDPSNSVAEPTMMYKPDNVKYIEWLKYYDESQTTSQTGTHGINTDIPVTPNTSGVVVPEYKYITILPNKQFIDLVNTFNTQETNVEVLNFTTGSESYKLFFKNDAQPSYCTVIKDYYIVFDSFDQNIDSTLQASKTMAWGQTTPSWEMKDTFIPSLDDQQFPLLLNEAKSLAFLELKQMSHPKAEQESKRQWSAIQKNKALVDRPSYFDALPDFGRKGTKWR